MITICKTARRHWQRRQLLLSSFLLCMGTTTIAAESASTVQLPNVLTTTISDAHSTELHYYQPIPAQSVAMPVLNNWQQANSKVKELGGWMFYASEADRGHAQKQQPAKRHKHNHSKHHHHADKTPTPTPTPTQTPAKDLP